MPACPRLPRALLLLACLAIALRFLVFGFLFAHDASGENFLQGDSLGYLAIAQNVADGHGFSQSTSTPYQPDAIRTPGYPLLIAGSLSLFHSFIPVILFQIFLSGGLTILAFLIARSVTQKGGVAYGVAALLAFEPFSVAISLVLLTEVVFTGFFLAGFLAVLKGIDLQSSRVWLWIGLASALFGCAALVKPIAQFLPLLLIVAIFCLWRRLSWRMFAMSLAMSVIPFVLVIAPWLMRNVQEFNSPILSSGGFQNVYSDLGATILAVEERRPYSEVKDALEADFASRHDISLQSIQGDLRWSTPLFLEGVGIIFAHPLATTKVVSSLSFTYFTHDLWVYYFQKWGIVRMYERGFSPMHSLLTEGPVVTAKKILSTAGPTVVLPVVGRIFWILTSLLFFFGVVLRLKRKALDPLVLFFLVACVLYFLVFSLSGGAGMTGRYRYPVNTLIFTLAYWFLLSDVLPMARSFFKSRRPRIMSTTP